MAAAPSRIPPSAAPTAMPAIAPVDRPLWLLLPLLLGSGAVTVLLDEDGLVALLLALGANVGVVVVREAVEDVKPRSVGRKLSWNMGAHSTISRVTV